VGERTADHTSADQGDFRARHEVISLRFEILTILPLPPDQATAAAPRMPIPDAEYSGWLAGNDRAFKEIAAESNER
jgi:hypothetical protein